MVQTVKFSQFVDGSTVQNGDTIVGLRGGVNTKFIFQGGGGGGGVVIQTITQATQPFGGFKVGQWVELVNGLYVLAKADTAANAEVIGVIQAIITPGLTFTVQQSGYITSLTGLTPSLPYYLDPNVAGAATQTEPFVNGQVSRPVLIADSATTAWVLPYRGYVINGGAPVNPGTGIVTRVITQTNHNFAKGNWLRTDGGAEPYVKALSDTLAHAQAVGVVIDVIDANNFEIQVDGYIGTGVFDTIAPLGAGTIFYLSDVTPGLMVNTPPVVLGEATKPVFSADSDDSGWILPQRPLTISNNGGGGSGVTLQVTQATQPIGGFQVGQWVRLDTTSPDALYVLAQADNEQDADTIGVIQSILPSPPNTFIIQQSGYMTTFSGLIPGTNYYLDPAVQGGYTSVEPVVNGQVNRPVMTAQNATNAWILPYRGYVVGGGAPVDPGTGIVTQIITQTNHNFTPGQWLRTDNADPTKPYVLALADSLDHAQVVGVVKDVIDPNHFTLQEDGFLGAGVFGSLTTGDIQYLSPTIPGAMQNTPPILIGQVSKPLMSAASATTGWVLPQRPILITSNGNGSSTITFTQVSPSFNIGDFVATSTTPDEYKLAIADSMSDAYIATGFIVAKSGTTYTLQQSGYSQQLSAVSPTDAPGNVVAGNTYFLSTSVPGKVQLAEPAGVSAVSRPVLNATDINGGWILPQRPIINGSGNVYLGSLNASNSYSSTTILQDASGNTFNQYLIICVGGIEAISLTGNVGIGFRFYAGSFISTPGTYFTYTSGVNSLAGPNTATWWGFVSNVGVGDGRDYSVIMPALTKHAVLSDGEGILQCTNIGCQLQYNFYTGDFAGVNQVGYTSIGTTGGVVPFRATGMQLYFTNSPTITGGAVIKVYGIPN